jgi:hypothetical protein
LTQLKALSLKPLGDPVLGEEGERARRHELTVRVKADDLLL